MIIATLKDKQNHDLIPGAEIVILTATLTENDYCRIYDPELSWGRGYTEYSVFHYRDPNNRTVMAMPTEELSACIKKH